MIIPRFILPVLVIALFLVGCGPSPEEIAEQTAAALTETAAAWTPTPTSTPTPTPIPYDLTVSLTDIEGNPVSLASIVFPDSGDDSPIAVDENGMLSWVNLPSESGNLDVTAQGYYSISEPVNLTRGLNEVSFILERDELQLLPAEACPGDQEVIYLEDFEDGFAQELEGIARPAWEFVTDDLRGTYLSGDEQTQNRLQFDARAYDNYVVHMEMLRPPDANVLWIRVREECCPSSYIGVFSRDGNTWLQPEGREARFFWPSRFISRPDGETWEKVSLSVFEGAFDLWIDDELLLGVTDPEPIGPGIVSIEITDHSETFAIDNLAICGLNDFYEPERGEEGSAN